MDSAAETNMILLPASQTTGTKMIVHVPYVQDNSYQKAETGPIPPPDTSMVVQQQQTQVTPDLYQQPIAPVQPGPVPPSLNVYQVPQNTYAVPQNAYVAPPSNNYGICFSISF